MRPIPSGLHPYARTAEARVPEVVDLNVSSGSIPYKDILQLEIPVIDIILVQVLQSFGDPYKVRAHCGFFRDVAL